MEYKSYVIKAKRHEIYSGSYTVTVREEYQSRSVLIQYCKNKNAAKLLIEFCKVQFDTEEVILPKNFFTEQKRYGRAYCTRLKKRTDRCLESCCCKPEKNPIK